MRADLWKNWQHKYMHYGGVIGESRCTGGVNRRRTCVADELAVLQAWRQQIQEVEVDLCVIECRAWCSIYIAEDRSTLPCPLVLPKEGPAKRVWSYRNRQHGQDARKKSLNWQMAGVTQNRTEKKNNKKSNRYYLLALLSCMSQSS